MADYIKREAADKALTLSAANDKDKNRRIWAKAICVLHDLPAADVAPVVHGRMVETDRPIRDGKSKVYGWECTACKRFTRSPFVDSWNYCPNRGARMDGDCNAAD